MSSRPVPPGGTFLLAGRPVARVGFGAMQLVPHGSTEPRPDRAGALAVLRRAVELGVDHVDTADFYGEGRVNALIREALAPALEGVSIVTKVGARSVGGRLVAAQRPEELRASVEANLSGLGVERVDVVNLRRLDAPPGIVAEGEQVVPLDAQLAELVALRDAGKIGAIGVSAVSLDQLAASLDAGIACVQNAFSAVERQGQPLLDLCRAHGIAWVPFFPLGSAFPGRPKVTDQPAVLAAATRMGATPAQVGLAWLLAHAPNVLLIPGTASLAHLAENVAAADVVLDAGTTAEIDALAGVAA